MGKKSGVRIAAVLILIILSTVSVSFGQSKVSLRLNGGPGWLWIGDTNDNIAALNAWYQDVSALLNGSTQKLYEKFHGDWNLDGQILFRLHPRWEVGAGFGLLFSGKADNEIRTTFPPKDIVETLTHDIDVKCVTLDIVHRLPVVKGVNLLARVGAGYYFAGWTEAGRYSEAEGAAPGYWREWDLDVNGSSIGVHGGIGLEIPLLNRISVLLEGLGRYANIGSLRGDGSVVRSNGSSTTVTNGTLYKYEYRDAGTGAWYKDVNLMLNAPTGETNRNAREATINLSGAELRLGLIIRLF